MHSFPWLSGASLEGEEDGSAQGFLLLGHPGVPSGLLKGSASPFFGFGAGRGRTDGWGMACSGGEARLSLKGQSPRTGWRGEMQLFEVQGLAGGYGGGL